ncbi:MAG: TRAP transporter small permease subunit [Deltaproteobacteria bacterium]|nr:TRAP transporter small permease subunit [Deltaproteobacteria bacterium]MBW2137285.1 TRAP transporter small permease subunit [Deltaproteobacteria bacterium]
MVSDASALISGTALVLLMLVTVAGIFLRAMRLPTTGFFEMITFLGLILFVSGWAHTQKNKGHLRVYILVSRLSRRTQFIIDVFIHVLAVCICAFMVINSSIFALRAYYSGLIVSLYFQVPVFVLAGIVSLFILLFELVLIVDSYDAFVRLFRER